MYLAERPWIVACLAMILIAFLPSGCTHGPEAVPQDAVEAAAKYRQAAEQGLDHAQFRLGECYHMGLGVAKD